jgi:hypothetical protein
MYIYEPFNDDAHHHFEFKQRFLYLTHANSPPYYRRLRALLGLGSLRSRALASVRALRPAARARDDLAAELAVRELVKRPKKFVRSARVCVKDPLAFFSAEWLAQTFAAQVVVMMRHPAGVISSYLKLGWGTDVVEVLQQRALCERFGGSLREEIEAFRRGEGDAVASLILQWKMFALAALALKRQHPDWLFVSHEQLCADPVQGFRRTYDYLDLPWTEAIEQKVCADSSVQHAIDPTQHQQHVLQRESRGLASAWKQRLEPNTIDRIHHETEPLWREVLVITSEGQRYS